MLPAWVVAIRFGVIRSGGVWARPDVFSCCIVFVVNGSSGDDIDSELELFTVGGSYVWVLSCSHSVPSGDRKNRLCFICFGTVVILMLREYSCSNYMPKLIQYPYLMDPIASQSKKGIELAFFLRTSHMAEL
jgi:hypothetical protein